MTFDSHRKWLSELKPGDEVYCSQEFGAPAFRAKVARRTKTLIIVAHKFRRLDGKVVETESRFRAQDGHTPGTGYGGGHLIQPTDEVRERVEIAHLKARVNFLRNHISTPGDKPTLLAMIEALQPFVKEEQIVPKEV